MKPTILLAALMVLLLGCSAQSATPGWWLLNAKLTSSQREHLADITDTVGAQCSTATWNSHQLWWECDGQPTKHGPRALLPMSKAEAHWKAEQEDTQWCDSTMSMGATDGWHQYSCFPDAKGPVGRKGRWGEDAKAEQAIADAEAHQRALATALTTRVLTTQEMSEVLQLGWNIYVYNMQPYKEEEVRRKYIDALEIQRELREMHLPTKEDEARGNH